MNIWTKNDQNGLFLSYLCLKLFTKSKKHNLNKIHSWKKLWFFFWQNMKVSKMNSSDIFLLIDSNTSSLVKESNELDLFWLRYWLLPFESFNDFSAFSNYHDILRWDFGATQVPFSIFWLNLKKIFVGFFTICWFWIS